MLFSRLAHALNTFKLNGAYLENKKRWPALDLHTSAPEIQSEQKITEFFNLVSSSPFLVHGLYLMGYVQIATGIYGEQLQGSWLSPPSSNRSWLCYGNMLIGKCRKPDLVLPVDYADLAKRISWKTLATVCEVKYSPHLEEDARIQVTDKALFTLSSQLDCRYFVGLTLCGPKMRVLWFTRGGSTVTKVININTSPQDFLYILAIFTLGKLDCLGYDEHFAIAPSRQSFLKYAGDAYTVIQLLFTTCSIQGQGTWIFVI